MLAKYQAALRGLEGAALESSKTEGVDIAGFLSDLETAATEVQQLIAMETNSVRKSALEQLSFTLSGHCEVLLAKKRQLERSDYRPPPLVQCTEGSLASQTCGEGEDSLAKRRRSAIEDTIVTGGGVWFGGVAGLSGAKQALREAIVLPLKYPHLFTTGHSPWKCVLLYGPPGTGKTRLAQAVSSEVECRFYCISSSDLLSSWLGESEKIIRELFQHARRGPGQSVIFIDEVDSVCRARSSGEDEHTRRVKTELLRQMEGADGRSGDVFLLCATNTPWELDYAFLRRCQRRLYIPLPVRSARQQLFQIHLNQTSCQLSAGDWDTLLSRTEGYSGCDIATCVSDALMEPIRELETTTHWRLTTPINNSLGGVANGCGPMYVPCDPVEPRAECISISELPPQQVCPRPVSFKDLLTALDRGHSTVSAEDLQRYEEFTSKYGQLGSSP